MLREERTFPKWIINSAEGVTVRFYVQPKASRSEIVGEYGEGESVRLKVRVAAPPVEGAANKELLCFLKKVINLPVSRIHIIRGESSRSKDVLFEGASEQEIALILLRAKH